MDREKLRNLVIDFIPNDSFQAGDKISSSSRELVNSVLASDTVGSAPNDLPAHLQRICSAQLLSHEEETSLFREMNYLKFKASQLQAEMSSRELEPAEVDTVYRLLEQAKKIRDHLIKANTRLVMSVVKKFVTPQNSFDDILSDGLITLMQAVEKFDYARGFRFSTYAYRSVARNAYRSVNTTMREEARITRDAEEWAFGETDASLSMASDQLMSNLSENVSRLVRRLDRREQFIVRSRYALGAHRKKRTFQFLADKLGVSKERARQLEKRAIQKLQDMASELEIDEFSGVIGV